MVSINRLLCPIDFSEFSSHAFGLAVAIAKAHRTAITAVHVVPVPVPIFVPGLEVNAPTPPTLTPGERESLLIALNEFTAAGRSAGVPIETDVVESPTVTGEILAQAARVHADLIVMGTHGRSGFQRLLLGSVTEKVVRTATQPVMTVGLTAAGGSEPQSTFTRVLCGIDFSNCSLAALRYALTLAEGTTARVTAVNVVEWLPFGHDPLGGPAIDLAAYHTALKRAARERLHKAVMEFAPKIPDVQEIIRSGRPHQEILQLAAEQGTDLIVLGIHGRTPIDRMLFGSTAEPVVRRASCPVLTVRAETAAIIAAA